MFMNSSLAQRLRPPERTAVAIAVAVVAIALAALLGWRIGSDILTSVIVGAIALQPTTAIALIVGAAGLFAGAVGRRWISRLAGLVLLAACGVWLVAYASPHAVPTDLLLFRREVLAQQPLPLWPGRPSIITCGVIALYAASLLGVGVRQPRLKLLALGAASLGALLASLSVLPFLLQDSSQLSILNQSLRIALNTSVAVGGLCIGVLILRRDAGWVRLVAGGGEQGRIARLLAPVALIPVAFGTLANIGVRAGAFGPDVRMLLIVVLSAVTLLFLAFWAAQTLGRERGRRDSLADALQRSTVMIVDGDGRLRHWPPACEALYGWTAAEVLGRRPGEFLNVEGASVRDKTRAAIREHGEWRGEIQHWTKAGDVRWVALQWVFQKGVADGEDRVVGTISDITDLKLMEASLRESRERLTLALDTYGLGIADTDVASGQFLADEGLDRIFGVEPGGMSGTITELRGRLLVEDQPATRAQIDAAVAAGLPNQSNELRIRRPDGELRDLHSSRRFFYSPEGVHLRTIGVYRDVTETKRAEAAAQENQERLALAVTAYDLGICDMDIASETIIADERLERMFGVAPGGLNGPVDRMRDTLVGADIENARRLAAETIAARKPSLIDDLRIQRPGGETRDLHGVRRFFYSPEGVHLRTIGVYRDVTDVKLVEAAAQEHQERLKLAVEAYDLGIADADIANLTVVADAGFERLLGLPRGGLEGSLVKLNDMVAEKNPDRDVDIAARRPQQFDEVRMRRADGEVRDFHGVRRFFYSPEGAHVRTIGIYRDVTEERRAQAELAVRGDHLAQLRSELAHVSRLSAMGEMAAALAHELNQPLTAIGNSVGALKIMLSDGGRTLDETARARILRAANQAEGQAVRAGEIVRRLRDFIARGEADARVEQLDRLIEDGVALAAPNAKADGTEVRFQFSPKANRVLADRIQIQQILVNLVRNANEAMRDRPGPHILTISTAAKHGMVEVSVRDSGPGVAADFATQLFSPFSSTKNDGMGVGLSICRRIVEAHGGRMWLEDSGDVGGADFRFTIPLVTKELQHA
jgi:two-component system sensor kinase FixL